MKTNRFYSHLSTFIVMVGWLASATPILAQTFAGRPDMTALPKEFRAFIYSLSTSPSTIKVNFDNPTSGSVRLVIRNEKGNTVYDEFEQVSTYRGRFDLSGLPTGHYTIELRKRNEQYVQTFIIEQPSKGRILMSSPLIGEIPDRAGYTKPISIH